MTRSTKRAFDLVVIGTGAGGSAPAHRCRAAGWSVAVVDELPFGGTCALRGCDPKKVLVTVAESVDYARRLRGSGVTGDTRLDWTAMMRFKRTFTDPVPDSREKGFRKAGIETLRDHAAFTAPGELRVGEETIAAKHVVIAAGARPATLNIPGEEHLITSTDFLELERTPASVVLVGGGFIGFEFAHILARAGARVTMLARDPPLKEFDADLVERLVEHTREIGVDVRIGTTAVRVDRGALTANTANAARGLTVRTEDGASFSCDVAVHAAGRVPAVASLDLNSAGIEWDEKQGVHVNDYLQSVSNAAVYATGDAKVRPESPALTPVAAHEGAVVAHNLLHENSRLPNYAGVTSVVFSIPPLAMTGLTEQRARARGIPVTVKTEDMSGWQAQRRTGERAAMSKTIVEESTGRLVGAHLLGTHAEEVINLFALAIRHGITADDLRRGFYGYPTGASNVASML